MKTVVLMRHAKSSWSDPDLDDFDRPLNARGIKAAPEMGKLLAGTDWTIDRIVSSPARRSAETAKMVAAELKLKRKIEFDDRLYLATPTTLLKVLRDQRAGDGTVMLVAHNPGISGFVDTLCGEELADMPTSGVAVIAFANAKKWGDVKNGQGQLEMMERPNRD